MVRGGGAYPARVVGLAVLYLIAAKASFAVAFVNTSISPVWLPSGVAVAAVVLFGYRLAPGVLLGAFVFNALTPVPLWVAALIAVGNTLEALGAAWLLRRVDFHPAVDRVRDVLALAGLGALTATAISASVGVASLGAAGVVPLRAAASSWILWWSGDAVGVLTLTPVLLWAWSMGRTGRLLSWTRLLEAGLLAVALAVVVWFGVSAGVAGPYVVFPAVVWAAIRFRQAGATLASLFSATVVVYATSRGFGPFVRPSQVDSLLNTQSFVAVVIATSLLVAAMTVERERAIKAMRDATAEAERERAQLDEAQRIAHLGSWEWDIGADLVRWSDELYRIYGVPPSTRLDYDGFLERVHPEDRGRVDAAVKAAFAEGGSFAFEHRIVRPDGQIRIQQGQGIAVVDGAGAVVRMVGTGQDVTERRAAQDALRAQQERTQAIIDMASDPFVSIDRSGIITGWNHSAQTLFGWRSEEAIGRALAATIIPSGQREAHLEGLRRVVAGEPPHLLGRRIELTALNRAGSEIPVELAIWRVESEAGPHFHAFLRDISERRRFEQELEAARDEALEASRLKSQFLATMSHEIRTPMNAIIGLTTLLQSGDLNAGQRRRVDGIQQASQALRAIIDDILDFSKIEAGRLILDDVNFDLDTVIYEAIGLLSGAANAKNLSLAATRQPDVSTDLRGDPARLRQILLNLVSNAIKFTEQGSVTVRTLLAEPAAEDGALSVRIEVTDTGVGIPADKQANLFDPFVQADASTTREFGGTGLGLAISRRLAEAMGGHLDMYSVAGEGSTFACTIAFPASAPIAAKASSVGSEVRPRGPAGGAKLLLVEDNDLNRLVAVEILTRLGYSIDIATDGSQAVSMAQTSQYQAILMDCQMPTMDGYTATATIRQWESGGQRTPIIALTASVYAEDQERCRAAGMDDFLPKPLDLDRLAATLARWTSSAVDAGKAQ
jgi:PAS domain S-box-containing protein